MKKKILFFLNIIFSIQLLSQNISFNIGSPITEIELTGINKEKIKLSDLRGKLVLIFGHHGVNLAEEKIQIKYLLTNTTITKNL